MSLIDGKVVGDVISERHQPHREMDFDFVIMKLRQEDVQAEIPERLSKTWEKCPKDMQEFESLV